MIPSIDDRLASIVRALTEVILPHLPPEASLAQEQAHLCIGHLQILRSQIDAAPSFEREELADAVALGRSLVERLTGCDGARAALAAAIDTADGSDCRGQRIAVNEAIEALVAAVTAGSNAGDQALLASLVIEHEQVRVGKDRLWCAPFGFDTL
jgi:hypothetical protein